MPDAAAVMHDPGGVHQFRVAPGATSLAVTEEPLGGSREPTGIPIVTAVSAPSSLAVRLASEANMTLIGFLRESGFNLYAGEERVEGVRAMAAPR